MRRIPVSKGQFALVSNCDFSYLSRWKWHCRTKITKQGESYYAVRNVWNCETRTFEQVAMHHEVARRKGLKRIGYIDHRDLNTLNNTRRNLRVASPQESSRNRRSWAESGLKGVTRLPSGRYRARIKINGKDKHLGTFGTPEDAHAAYAKAAKKHFGKFANP